jgi:hypothetical protein
MEAWLSFQKHSAAAAADEAAPAAARPLLDEMN